MIHAEHIFAEISAVAEITDSVGGNDEFVARGKDAQFSLFLGDVEKVTLVGLGSGYHDEVLDQIACLSVKPYVFVHMGPLINLHTQTSSRHRQIQSLEEVFPGHRHKVRRAKGGSG